MPVDSDGNTAGDISLSLNDEESYRAIRDAGIRSGVFITCVVCRMTLKFDLCRTYPSAAILSRGRGRCARAQGSGPYRIALHG